MPTENSADCSHDRWRTIGWKEEVVLVRTGRWIRQGLPSEMVGNAEHKQIGSIVCRDIAAVELELSKVILVLNERGN